MVSRRICIVMTLPDRSALFLRGGQATSARSLELGVFAASASMVLTPKGSCFDRDFVLQRPALCIDRRRRKFSWRVV